MAIKTQQNIKAIRDECNNQSTASILTEKRRATQDIEQLITEHKETMKKLRKKAYYYLAKKNKDITDSMSDAHLTFLSTNIKRNAF